MTRATLSGMAFLAVIGIVFLAATEGSPDVFTRALLAGVLLGLMIAMPVIALILSELVRRARNGH